MTTPPAKARELEEVLVTVERRVWVRYGSELEAVCRAPSARKEVGWTARVRDVSRGGVALILRHPFRPGTSLLVELRDRSGAVRRVMVATVAHARVLVEAGQPYWLMGCAFDAELTEDELQLLV